ncbi:uncharacterized protein METZ01_LOCUS408776, partial [marine metagenome]
MTGDWKEPEGEKFALGSLEQQAHWQSEYHRIVGKVREEMRQGDPQQFADTSKTFGEGLPRNDVLYKVRGQARYVANIPMEDALHCLF